MGIATLTDRYNQAHATLANVNQEHALAFFETLSESQQDQLLTQIEGIDWPEVARLIETHVKQSPAFELAGEISPAPWYPYQPSCDLQSKYDKARTLGEQLVRDGKVAAFTVAGGQGTRLGWDAPKGTFPATPIRQLSLFGCFAEYLQAIQQRYNAIVPWYVMTSPINDAATRAFFQQQNNFGLDRHNITIFPQAMMPAIDMQTAKVLLADKASLALSPNGHGGSLKALYTSGAIDDMLKRGVEQISYVQVDNPITRVIDPLFIGLHALDSAQMSSKMLPKREPMEKLGNFCRVDGKMAVIEYSSLPDKLAVQRLDDGELRFKAGSIALHVIRVDFVQHLNESAEGFALPFNRAEKKVPYLDTTTQQPMTPSEPNAIKLETFVFDALPMTNVSIVYEANRNDEFAPIKNANDDGVLDSPATSVQLQIERAAAWLESNGVAIPRNEAGEVDATLEIKATTALYANDLKDLTLPAAIACGAKVLL